MTTNTLNSLSRASSAYMRSAMHQPIQWREWGRRHLPPRSGRVSPCCSTSVPCGFWCHVMDRERATDPEIAACMNKYFIACSDAKRMPAA